MRIIYLFDFNCPFSYIGLERLKRAIDELDLNVEWEMRSFELDYNSLTGYDAREIEEIASADGLDMNLKDLKPVSSRNAHRLTKFVENKHHETTLELVEKIFRANFTENENISDIDTLTRIASSCKLDEGDVREILEGDSYGIEVDLDLDEALFNGITATPYIIINRKEEKLIIPGVFPTEEFKTALKDLKSGDIRNKTFI